MEDVTSNKRKMKELEDNLLYRLTSTQVSLSFDMFPLLHFLGRVVRKPINPSPRLKVIKVVILLVENVLKG